MNRDRGARNLVLVFGGVWTALGCFYSYLAVRSLTWSPALFIDNVHYERPLAAASEPAVKAGADTRFVQHRGVQRGHDLYRRLGCAACHGVAGQQGLANKNYVKDQVPPLKAFAETLLLYEPEDIAAVLPVLAAGKSLDSDAELDLPNPAAVVAKYVDARKVVLDGKKDEKGVQPIDMPAWKSRLAQRDINHIFAYLLTLYRPPEK
jgi:mono/diheme cytochrome c family protein